jgi:hypothetical protein
VKPVPRTASGSTAKALTPPPQATPAAPVAVVDQSTATSRRTDTARTNKPATKPPVVAAGAHQAPTASQPVVQNPAPNAAAPATPSISTGLPQRDTKPLEVATPPRAPAVSDNKPSVDAAAEAEVARAREAVESYVRAIGAKRLETLRQIFPGMNQQTRDGYEAFFRNVSDLSTQLVGTPTITLHGSSADAEFVSEMKYRDPSRGNVNQNTTFRARLQRTDQGWIILSLGAVQ